MTNEEVVRKIAEIAENMPKVYKAIQESAIPKIDSINLLASEWQGSESPYSQVLNINGITANNRVDLSPTTEQLDIFHKEDIALVTENNKGVVTIFCIGQKPQVDYTVQISVTNVVANNDDIIVGGIITTPSVVGKKVTNGGEIFNDYDNNNAISELSHAEGNSTLAGSKAFIIVDMIYNNEDGSGTYILDGVDGLAVGDVYSVIMTGNYENYGKITNIDGLNVTVDKCCGDSFSDVNYFRIIKKPLVGTTIIGTAAHAEGYNTHAELIGSHAEGYNTHAGGKYSHAEGQDTVAGYSAHAEGWGTQATGHMAHAEGYYTKATSDSAHAEGNGTIASGPNAHAEGTSTVASGQYSHAEGNGSKATGIGAHAEGYNSEASGQTSHAEGNSKAKGNTSHAEGTGNAEGTRSHAENSNAQAIGTSSHAGGTWSYARGENSFAHGEFVEANGKNEVVFGSCNDKTKTDVAFAVGNGTDRNSDRRNAITVYKDGSAEITKTGEADNSVVTRKFVMDLIASVLPKVTPDDAGSFLCVDKDGKWVTTSLSNAEDTEF